MKDYCMLEVAFDNRDEVNRVASKLLDLKLVASCHIIESDSSWNWHNEREWAKEYLLQMKTKKSELKEIYDVVREIHSYDCFEFATYDLSSINIDYLKWIDDEVK